MQLSQKILRSLHEKALAKGVDLNKSENFDNFMFNYENLTNSLNNVIDNYLKTYQCVEKGKKCLPCEAKRKAQEDARLKEIHDQMAKPMPAMPAMPDMARHRPDMPEASPFIPSVMDD